MIETETEPESIRVTSNVIFDSDVPMIGAQRVRADSLEFFDLECAGATTGNFLSIFW